MPTVRISYHPDNSLIGKTREVDDQQARDLVREGRAVIVEDTDELKAMTKTELLKHAARLGVPVTQSATKDDIADAIRGAQASGEATTAPPGGAGVPDAAAAGSATGGAGSPTGTSRS